MLVFIPIKNSNEKCGVYVKNDVIIPLTNDEYENISVVIDVPQIIDFTIKKDESIGFVKFYHKNNLIFEEKIYTIIE